MLERRERWDSVLGRLPGGPEARDRAEFLRDAMLTHLELVKRRVTNRECVHGLYAYMMHT
jgi:hypothetical protein